jgi:serine/threonine protein kinase
MSKEKKLGSGFEGDVYLVTKDGEQMIKKIQHIKNEHAVVNLKYPVWREIAFSTFSKNYPQYFTLLKAYTIDSSCSYKKDKPKNFTAEEMKRWHALQKSNTCVTYYYTPVLDSTIRKVELKLGLCKLRLQFLLQQLYILYLLQAAGWYHCDAHTANWLFRDRETTVSLTGLPGVNFKLKTKQLYLCDYGLITHVKFPLDSSDDKPIKYFDLVMNIYDVLLNMKILYTFVKHGDFLDFKDMYSALKKTEVGSKIKFTSLGNTYVDRAVFFCYFLALDSPLFYQTIAPLLKKPAARAAFLRIAPKTKLTPDATNMFVTMLKNITKPKACLTTLYKAVGKL